VGLCRRPGSLTIARNDRSNDLGLITGVRGVRAETPQSVVPDMQRRVDLLVERCLQIGVVRGRIDGPVHVSVVIDVGHRQFRALQLFGKFN
jgi:hypothetical protein